MRHEMSFIKNGFTLVELMVVVLILGALAFVAVPRISESTTTAKKNACNNNVDIMNKQIELFMIETGAYPDSDDLKDEVGLRASFPDGIPVCPFGDDYTYNKTLKRVESHNH